MQEKKASVQFIEKCYRLYEQKMYQIAYSILRDEASAEDAVQEAFLKLMKNDTVFEDVTSNDCKRYIITVIKHSSITIYNKKKREQQIMYLSNQDDMQGQAVEEMNDTAQEKLRESINKLPDKYYAVVNCMVVEELSVKETAKKLSITEVNVRKRFERAKLLLKTIMKGRNDYEKYRNTASWITKLREPGSQTNPPFGLILQIAMEVYLLTWKSPQTTNYIVMIT